jgi:hypothetical protein
LDKKTIYGWALIDEVANRGKRAKVRILSFSVFLGALVPLPLGLEQSLYFLNALVFWVDYENIGS